MADLCSNQPFCSNNLIISSERKKSRWLTYIEHGRRVGSAEPTRTVLTMGSLGRFWQRSRPIFFKNFIVCFSNLKYKLSFKIFWIKLRITLLFASIVWGESKDYFLLLSFFFLSFSSVRHFVKISFYSLEGMCGRAWACLGVLRRALQCLNSL